MDLPSLQHTEEPLSVLQVQLWGTYFLRPDQTIEIGEYFFELDQQRFWVEIEQDEPFKRSDLAALLAKLQQHSPYEEPSRFDWQYVQRNGPTASLVQDTLSKAIECSQEEYYQLYASITTALQGHDYASAFRQLGIIQHRAYTELEEKKWLFREETLTVDVPSQREEILRHFAAYAAGRCHDITDLLHRRKKSRPDFEGIDSEIVKLVAMENCFRELPQQEQQVLVPLRQVFSTTGESISLALMEYLTRESAKIREKLHSPGLSVGILKALEKRSTNLLQLYGSMVHWVSDVQDRIKVQAALQYGLGGIHRAQENFGKRKKK